MKLIGLTKDGLKPVIARRIYSKKFDHYFYAISNGEVGCDACWQIRVPIPRSEYAPGTLELDTEGLDFKLIDLKKTDAAGQSCYMLERGKPNQQYLVFIKADRVDSVMAAGTAELLPAVGHGLESKYLLFLVKAGAKIRVKRMGRILEGEATEFGMVFDGEVCRSKRRFVFDEEEVIC